MVTWNEFISKAVAEQDDSPAVQRLREELAAGARLVRVNLAWEDKQKPPGYVVTLELPQRRSPQHIPVQHSASFMRWCMETKARLATHEEELQRLLFLLDEPLRALERELGSSYYNSILVQHLRTLGPPRAVSMLSGYSEPFMGETLTRARAFTALEDVLADQARTLRMLGYKDAEVAALLDGALERYLDERFRLSLRRSLLGQ